MQVEPGGQSNSPPWQGSAHSPSMQRPGAHRSPSSRLPSQSSSRLLQVSVMGVTPPKHWTVPAMQAVIPGAHSPMLSPQGNPRPGMASSTSPLQSSSRPLQVSAAPPTAPSQTSAPVVQTNAPGAQTEPPTVQ